MGGVLSLEDLKMTDLNCRAGNMKTAYEYECV